MFVIGTKGPIPGCLSGDGPIWAHTPTLQKLASTIDGFVWWNLPKPECRTQNIDDVVEQQVPFDKDDVATLIPENHLRKFEESGRKYATGYRRTRNGRQVLEIRCDGVAGCLRTPAGGSSRQYLVHRDKNGVHARLLTTREVACLMGAPNNFELPGTYNDGYFAMGDAVAVPVAKFLSDHLLTQLVEAAYAV